MTDEIKKPEGSLTLSDDQKMQMDHLAMYENVEQNLSKLSKRDLARVLLALICPSSKENGRIEKLSSRLSKVVYTFGYKCVASKFSQLFQGFMQTRGTQKE